MLKEFRVLRRCSLKFGDALKLRAPPALTRRTAIAGFAIVGLPGAALAVPGQSEFSGYKTRDYGNGENTATGAKEPDTTVCGPKVKGCKPDGFGGYVRRDAEVKPLNKRVADAAFGGDDAARAAPAAPKAAAPKKESVGTSTRSSSSTPQPTKEELLSTVVGQKEAILGRPLTDIEKKVRIHT